jgi:uncharacterized protein (TIGR02588 family)
MPLSTGRKKSQQTPALEWVAAGTGVVFLVGLLGVIGAEALAGGTHEPPAISIKVGEVTRAGDTYVAAFEAVNASGGTAAALQVEGKLVDGDVDVETSLATIDYVSAHGTAEGGLIFSQDPKGLTIVARPLGYQTP